MFPRYLINGTTLEKMYWTWNASFDFTYNFCLEHLSVWEEFSEILLWRYIRLHIKYPLILSDFNETWIFSTDFRRIHKCQLKKMRPVGAELFHAEGQTDMTMLTVAFRNFANGPKKVVEWLNNILSTTINNVQHNTDTNYITNFRKWYDF
jgi:hypothetical protein